MDWICGFLTGCIAGCISGLVLTPCRKETVVVVTRTPRLGGVLRMDWSRCEFPGSPDGWGTPQTTRWKQRAKLSTQ